jgi:4-oxalocrotonate tautomerase
MPILNLSVSAQADAKLSASISEVLTEATRVHLGKDPKVTAVVLQYIAPTDWIIGGKSLAELGQKSFSLDIKVTAATNTKTQIAGYIEAVFLAMERLLGAVHQTSYIVVHEVAAATWGFGGKTQEFRFIEAKIKDAA